jgi:uncharacterized membrane protein (UPF0127 family)
MPGITDLMKTGREWIGLYQPRAPNLATSLRYTSEDPMLTTTILTPSGETILAYVAATARERRRGASGWIGMPSGRGLLLAFEQPGHYEITMRGMQFDLDILWLGSDQSIVGWARGYFRSTMNYLNPVKPASYVLELGADEMQRLGLKLGDVLRF